MHPLGTTLPVHSKHACSGSMPTWADIDGYEKGDRNITQKLKIGYPRFLIHPRVKELFRHLNQKYASDQHRTWAFPSIKIAKEVAQFIGENDTIKVFPYNPKLNLPQDLGLITFPKEYEKKVKKYWQHCGHIISSRLAEKILNRCLLPKPQDANFHEDLQIQISQYYSVNPEDVYLYPSGMSAIASAHKILLDVFPQKKSVQWGFPYIDTLKRQELWGAGVHFFGHSDQKDFQTLEKLLNSGESISGIFLEFPSNPLLKSSDLKSLKTLATQYQVPLLIDDTLAPATNVDLSQYTDIYLTSLTKYFSGSGDVMAGSLILNPKSQFYGVFKQSLNLHYEPLLFAEDAKVLLKNSQDFGQRITKINHNAEKLATFLQQHPLVRNLYYPRQADTKKHYDAVKRESGGYGGLLSFTLKDPKQAAPLYDQLMVCKGPSLGTNFTLVSPYTRLAHFYEFDWAAQFGITPELLRVSVGTESSEWILSRFKDAFAQIPT